MARTPGRVFAYGCLLPTLLAAAPPPDPLAGVAVSPDPVMARTALVEAARARGAGRRPEAVVALVQAFRHGVPDYDIYRRLGRLHLEAEDLEAARLCLQRALETGGPSPDIHLAMGNVEGLSGNPEREIESYQKAVALHPNDAEGHFLLAMAYDKVGNSPKVLEHAQRAIRLDPAYKERLKPRIRDSNVSRKIGALVTRVLEDSKYERLTDESIQAYADEIGRILGEENLKAEPFALPARSPFVAPDSLRRPPPSAPPPSPESQPEPEPEPEPPMRGFLR